MRSLSRIYLILIASLLMSQTGCAAAVKKTPMQKAENMAYCWTPDGKIAFYRRIDHWIKMEPDPFPGGGGVYDDYEKNDEAFIVVRDPETKEEKVLFKLPYKGSAGYANYMDWSPKTNKILLSTGAIYILSPDGSDFKDVVRKEGGLCGYGAWSPDSKQILYAYLPRDPQYMDNEDITKMVARGENPGLYIVNADGSSDKFLVEGENGSWSPDEKQIVYQEIRKHMIYIINTDGTGKRLLVEGGQNPRWSPDGKWIMFHIRGRTYLISSTEDKKCFVNGYGLLSKDGKSVLSSDGRIGQLKVIDETFGGVLKSRKESNGYIWKLSIIGRNEEEARR